MIGPYQLILRLIPIEYYGASVGLKMRQSTATHIMDKTNADSEYGFGAATICEWLQANYLCTIRLLHELGIRSRDRGEIHC